MLHIYAKCCQFRQVFFYPPTWTLFKANEHAAIFCLAASVSRAAFSAANRCCSSLMDQEVIQSVVRVQISVQFQKWLHCCRTASFILLESLNSISGNGTEYWPPFINIQQSTHKHPHLVVDDMGKYFKGSPSISFPQVFFSLPALSSLLSLHSPAHAAEPSPSLHALWTNTKKTKSLTEWIPTINTALKNIRLIGMMRIMMIQNE